MKICSTLFAAAALFTAHTVQAQSGAQPEPKMKHVLDTLAGLNPKPIETLSPEEARRQPSIADAAMKVMKERGLKPQPVGDISNHTVEIGPDAKVKVRVYTPSGDGPFPVIEYIHGGGWVIADLDTYDATPRALSAGCNAVVVSSEYRHAPENKFPAAHQDVYGVYQWLLKNAGQWKGDASKIALLGESAGGNMACAISLMAKEAGLPLPVAQVLVYPVADLTTMDTPSYQDSAEAKPLNKAMLEWFGKHALAKPEDKANPRLSLLKAGDELKGLEPTTIINAEIDPLRSEGEALAKALEAAGVQTHQKTFAGVTHEFFGLGAVVDVAKEAQEYAFADLKAAFGQ